MLASLMIVDQRLSQSFQFFAQFFPTIWKIIAIGGVYIVPFFLVWYWFARDRLTALRAATTGLIAWFAFSNTISHLIIRERPLQIEALNFPNKEVFFDRPGPSFPSDHAAFMTAIAVSFYLAGERKLWPYMACITVLTLLARIVTAQHWIGDILVGCLVGGIAGFLVYYLHRPLDRWILKPIINITHKIGL